MFSRSGHELTRGRWRMGTINHWWQLVSLNRWLGLPNGIRGLLTWEVCSGEERARGQREGALEASSNRLKGSVGWALSEWKRDLASSTWESVRKSSWRLLLNEWWMARVCAFSALPHHVIQFTALHSRVWQFWSQRGPWRSHWWGNNGTTDIWYFGRRWILEQGFEKCQKEVPI